MITQIPITEYKNRINKIQDTLKRRDIDILVVFGTDCEPQNLIYLSNYWPQFETGAVVIPNEGKTALVIGPESETFAREFSTIDKIFKVIEHRESSEPNYPNERLDTYSEDIMINIRMKKTANEIELLKQSSQITLKAFETAINNIKAGMEEIEVAGFIAAEIFRNKAENFAFAPYVLSGNRTNQAISRATHKIILKNEPIQLSFGCRYRNYSSSIGRPLSIGKMPEKYKKLVNIGIATQEKVISTLKPGIEAKKVFETYWDFLVSKGFSNYFLYGPCHGTGVMECEHPFLESDSDYILEEGMTFQVDIFLGDDEFGLRFEDGALITSSGAEIFVNDYREVIEI
jgi:Xaa-Pro aminopeptidase